MNFLKSKDRNKSILLILLDHLVYGRELNSIWNLSKNALSRFSAVFGFIFSTSMAKYNANEGKNPQYVYSGGVKLTNPRSPPRAPSGDGVPLFLFKRNMPIVSHINFQLVY